MTRGALRALMAVGVAAAGCGDNEPAPLPPVSALTLNVKGSDTITDPIAGQAIADQIASYHPDFVALQECVNCGVLLQKLPQEFSLAPGWEDSELGVLYDSEKWDAVDSGVIVLGSNDDGWGRREARWAELSLLETGHRLYLYSTHWCVPIRNTDDACDVEKQLEYGRAILNDVASRDAPAIIGGDFNVFDGFESGPVIEFLVANGWTDTLRAVTQAPVVTFEGNSWAPPGRIDYVFATDPVEVLDASVAADSASDHRPVFAELLFPRR